jgi:hypothetical protein
MMIIGSGSGGGFNSSAMLSSPVSVVPAALRARAEMPVHGKSTDDEFEFYGGTFAEKFFTPCDGAFGSRWHVARPACAGITKTHRQQRHALRVLKRLAIKAEPLVQAVAAGFFKGNTGCVDLAAARSAGDRNSRGAGDLRDRARANWQIFPAKCTRPDVLLQYGGGGFVH